MAEFSELAQHLQLLPLGWTVPVGRLSFSLTRTPKEQANELVGCRGVVAESCTLSLLQEVYEV